MPYKNQSDRTNYARTWRNKKENRARFRKILRTTSQKRRKAIRIEILQLLGNKCIRCGFSDWRALQIDHKIFERDKHAIKRKLSGGETYYKKILKEINAGSKNYQLLCANCNWIKRYENEEWRAGVS